jgi:hypothetical protein
MGWDVRPCQGLLGGTIANAYPRSAIPMVAACFGCDIDHTSWTNPAALAIFPSLLFDVSQLLEHQFQTLPMQ